MEKYELPLVIFTVLSQMSVGITLILTLRTLQGKLESKRLYWLVSGLVLAAASVAAILHLAHPDRAYDALINLQHAWLSREILGATLYGAAVGVTFLAKGHKAPAVLASVLGIALVAVQGMTYAAPAMVAIANGLTMLLFFITVWVMGCAAIPLHRLNQDDPEGISGIRLDYTESNERKLRVGEGLRRLMCSMRNDASKNLKRSTSYRSANNAILFAPIKTTVKCLKTIFKF